MTYSGVLGYSEEYFDNWHIEPTYFMDLNLNQIVDYICGLRRDYKFKHYFYRMPDSNAVSAKRLEVLKDFEKDAVAEAFACFSDRMKEAREFAEAMEKTEIETVRRRYLFDCGEAYVAAVECLCSLFANEENCASDYLKGFGEWLLQYTATDEYRKLKSDTDYLSKRFSEMRVQVALVRDKMKITLESTEGSYRDTLLKVFPEYADRNVFMENPFRANKEPGELEQMIYQLLAKSSPEVFEALRKYENDYSVIVRNDEKNGAAMTEKERRKYLEKEQLAQRKVAFRQTFLETLMLDTEQQIQFYIAFDLFRRQMAKTDYPFAYPRYAEQFFFEEGYDLALLLKSMYSQQRVICNDAVYRDGEAFFVVTGPNQGGKTTFARSVGQIVYFSQMGLQAPARAVQIPYFKAILTHFSVEESMETGRGKLKEELVRLSPMMKEEYENSFVIINELFTTAATYDAFMMGKRVMDHFISKKCLGIYVTHIQELAKEENGVVSLSACVREDDPRKRTFRILRKEAEGTGYAYGIVEKYHLTYHELAERLQQAQIGTYQPADSFME